MNRPQLGRLVALALALVVAMGVIVVRLAILQVSRAGAFQAIAFDQRVHPIELAPWRGQIVDRTLEPLAMSVHATDIYADPRYVEDAWTTSQRLAGALGEDVDVEELVDDLTADTSFVFVARQAENAVAERIDAMGLPGIGFLDVSARSYPAGPLAPHVLGFVDIDGNGISGLEYQYDSLLAGTPGERIIELDPSRLHRIAGGVDRERPPVPGSDLVTTIDRDFQYQVQAGLEEYVERNRARGGTVVVMDRRTGDVLAMATYPWFDPNDPAAAKEGEWRNRAITDVFEPGSTNKVITAACALEEDVIGLEERLSVPWKMDVGPFTIHDSHPHPVQPMTIGDILAQSSNIGAVQVAERLGPTRMSRCLSRFGLGHQTGIAFPGEDEGIVPPLWQWTDSSLPTMAYGQGIAVTPLQMISVFSTIANDGVWVQPRLVRGTIDPGGTFHRAADAIRRRVVSVETARTVTSMLALAVDEGTGSGASIAGYQVAGKTGTARIPRPQGGYYTGRSIASFIGFLPAGDPDVVIAAILDRPTTVYGGIAAAPLFQTIARYAIERLGIAPAEEVVYPPTVRTVR
ncbi:MAG TPA: penicillin-binding protein 2 [Actinomycetota bacterium]|nr:penicillin-binding protein 2 [Actinomycetota bacterium]